MQTILVPTDFSATAMNAARYALQLASQLHTQKIVLYHSYEIPVTIDPMVPGIQMLDVDSLKEESARELGHFREQLLPDAKGILLEGLNEYGALSEGLDDVCKNAQAGLVVMGITGGGFLEEKLIGSNAVSVAKHTNVPVIIVPAHANFSRIGRIMLTSDFDKADQTIPVDLVRKIVTETGAELHVFNMETEPDEYAVDYPSNVVGESYSVHTALQDLHPAYHYSHNTDFVTAVNDFTAQNGIDLIITIPKKHGFFGSLFSESHTKQLAFHSEVPVMVIHE